MHYLVNRYIEKLGISVGKAVGVIGRRLMQAGDLAVKEQVNRNIARGMIDGVRAPKEFLKVNWTHAIPSEKKLRRGLFNILSDLRKAKGKNLSKREITKLITSRMKDSPIGRVMTQL